ncbi:MAG: nucleoside triphosphate pyrophosphohydrolase [Candidatus Andersenbacteria bacterium]|nr:nucleoside triphosphate pyrophosphohydrolase [Candidatus Andersenbacteria bacterium]
MQYHKLVRDKIPAVIKKSGSKAVYHIAKSSEYSRKLKEKLTEEVIEFLKSEEIEELADIVEVVEALAVLKKSTLKKVLALKQKKRRERGGFTKRVILEES